MNMLFSGEKGIPERWGVKLKGKGLPSFKEIHEYKMEIHKHKVEHLFILWVSRKMGYFILCKNKDLYM